MHTNYYFLRQLAPALEPLLRGLRFMECFSQDRDEVVLVFAQAKGKINYYKPFYIKATLRPDFSGLLFPADVQRARINSVDLFDAVTHRVDNDGQSGDAPAGQVVVGVRSFLNERCLAIRLADDYALLFNFFGNRPNLLLFHQNAVVDLFNHKLTTDQQLRLDALDRPIDQSYAAFERAGFDHRKLFPTFGKVVNTYLDGEHLREKSAVDQWALIQDVLRQLEHPRYYLTQLDHKPTLSLLRTGEVQQEFDAPIEAANRFFIAYNGLSTFEHEKAHWLRLLDKRRKRARTQIEINLERLIARDEGASHEEMGHILMASLHQVPAVPGARSPERVTLTDFYRDQPITLRLKPDLSPQKNAENFYRKAKNEKIEADFLNGQITTRETEMARIDQQRTELAAVQSLKELRRYVKQHNLAGDELSASDGGPTQLFKEVRFEGYRILIGRNAKNNDLLTQKYTHKEDLWLHARDVPGSHVVVKYQAGKTFPRSVIERAAELAAWYSKRRTDSLCPVTVTPKKYVRKPKGLAEGQVIVDKEDVVMVAPAGE